MEERIFDSYAIGGAVAATFYMEPFATLDIDVFVHFAEPPESGLLSLSQIYEFSRTKGWKTEGEYIVIGEWPVQFLPPSSPLEEEAIDYARSHEVDGIPVRLMTAEHLMAMALKLGRAKDYARLIQFVESGAAESKELASILERHGLLEKWEEFSNRFLDERGDDPNS
ncbi:MAG: hypothetical protein AAGA58_02765 [Verrucomicrobiota bacterium]